MYIIKNALKGITRAKGRSILIGIIVLVISLSACISLSIQSASDQAAEDAMKNLKITAQIGIDREAMMQGKDSKEDKKEALEGAQDLTLEELQKYAEAESVSDFYYTASASLNGESIEPVDTTGTSDSDTTQTTSSDGQNQEGMPGQGGQMGMQQDDKGGGRMGTQGDFTITGYSSDSAMKDFVDGSSSITEGKMFAEGTQTIPV